MRIIESTLENRLTESLVLCEADESDVPELKKAEDLCFPCDGWSAGMFVDAIKNDNCRIYILYNTQLSKIVAYCVMYYCLDEADLANIATVPDDRGKGKGKALIDEMFREALKYGASRIFLEVRESNTPALSLYRSRDFKEIGRRKKYYRNPTEDAVIMVREA